MRAYVRTERGRICRMGWEEKWGEGVGERGGMLHIPPPLLSLSLCRVLTVYESLVVRFGFSLINSAAPGALYN